MVLKGGSFESCKFVLGTQTRSQNISRSQTCTLFCFMWMFFELDLLKCMKKLKEMRILGVNEISSFPKQKCPPTHIKFYCKIDNLLTTLLKVTCWVQYATCGIWVVGINCVKVVQIMKLLFWGASVVFLQVFFFLVLFCFCPIHLLFSTHFYNFAQNKGNY